MPPDALSQSFGRALSRRSETARGERRGMRAMLLIWSMVIVTGLAYFIAIGLAGR